jgi:hypothetical protein
MKKTVVLGVLFILPLVVYLFFASGVTNFGKLPILNPRIDWSEGSSAAALEGKISLIIFLGDAVSENKGYLFNFNQKIYKRFSEFEDFQTVLISTPDQEVVANEVLAELATITDVSRYRMVFVSNERVQELFDGLQTPYTLDSNFSSPYVFISDKEAALRGRDDDEDEGLKYAYDMRSVAELNNKMEDDMKIILAEYRLALKKNNANNP